MAKSLAKMSDAQLIEKQQALQNLKATAELAFNADLEAVRAELDSRAGLEALADVPTEALEAALAART